MPTVDSQSRNARGLLLSGFDGSNLLGFLAAVGTLRTVCLAEPEADWRMKWVMHDGTWVPEMDSDGAVSTEEALIDLLCRALQREATPEFEFSNNLNIEPERFKAVATSAQRGARIEDRRYADFVAAFGCELCTADKGKHVQDTALRTMSGAGHQHFLGTMKQLVQKTGAEHLHGSLFRRWNYSDDKLGLRWDPEEDRRYALRWGNPAKGGVKTVRGANRLAVEGLPMFPTAPVGHELQTTAFSVRDRATIFTWPIWQVAAGMDLVRSLLALPEIQKPEPNRQHLHAIGIAEVYASERLTIGKFRNFARAMPA